MKLNFKVNFLHL